MAFKSLPSRRHCRRIPPDDIFFSASISVNPRELANISTSTRLISLCKNVTEVSTERPWVGSIFSSSCCKVESLVIMSTLTTCLPQSSSFFQGQAFWKSRIDWFALLLFRSKKKSNENTSIVFFMSSLMPNKVTFFIGFSFLQHMLRFFRVNMKVCILLPQLRCTTTTALNFNHKDALHSCYHTTCM